MARDGLLPAFFGTLDRHGNPFLGTLVSGTLLILLSIVVPFQYLWDFISLGILLAFNLTNTALVAVRIQEHRYPVPMARPPWDRPRPKSRDAAAPMERRARKRSEPMTRMRMRMMRMMRMRMMKMRMRMRI
jgi:amino acid transporter